MKYSNLRAFEKHLQDSAPSHLANLYLILSKDSFERKTAQDRLIPFLLGPSQKAELALKTFNAERCSIEEILHELNALDFFSQKKVVLIQQAEKLAKPSMTALEAYFEKPNSSLFLIVSAGAINHATHFYKKLEKNGVVLEIAELKPWEKEKAVSEWVVSLVSAEGKSMEPRAIQYLLKHMGTDQAFLQQELAKIFCYVGERRQIVLQDVAVISTNVNVENIWQLGDAIFAGDAPGALRIGKALLADGDAFLAVLRQIRHQFQTKFQICSILNSGGSAQEIVQHYPYMKGAILEKNIQMAQNYGMSRFKKGMLKIDETERQAKNSALNPDLLLELLIVALVQRQT